MKTIKLLAILIAFFITPLSQADETRGFYIGAGVGSTSLDDKDNFFSDIATISEDSNTYKLIAGYQVNRILAIEGQYTKYGDVNFQVPSLQNRTVYDWSPQALSLSSNAGYTFNNGLRPFGILGLSILDLNQSAKVLDKENYLGLRYGLGLEYAPISLRNLSIRVGYEADFFYADEEYIYHGIYSDYTLSKIYDFTLDSFYMSVSYKF